MFYLSPNFEHLGRLWCRLLAELPLEFDVALRALQAHPSQIRQAGDHPQVPCRHLVLTPEQRQIAERILDARPLQQRAFLAKAQKEAHSHDNSGSGGPASPRRPSAPSQESP